MRNHATWMLALTLVASPTLSFGANPAASASAPTKLQLQNVQLTSVGSLQGQLVTNTGQAVPNAKIIVRSQSDSQKVSQQLTTDKDGRFQATSLKTGKLVLQADEETYAVRVWKDGTAPPKSISTVALVQADGQEVVRGNRFTNRVNSLTQQQKIGLGLLVAAAVIIPIAVNDDGS
ncbi:MAG: carboxypeptidase regulatory-like domain-containing protein [Fuerstiella sp.]|nr:carboxypeptidase regulatory-like domain-containing protein [Fuerstiella sp.]MCP4858892.1 carboxypeptidase regulatory-like domain-containing protein [Fuerstiella sp.]